jgi:serine-threonine kinase receptor-associated protein
MELSAETGRLVLTAGKTVAFVPAAGGANAPAHTLVLPYAPSSASIHPTLQDRFVTGSTADEWVRVHGIDGAEREVLKGHHGPVHSVAFSPDGEMYASGSGEQSHDSAAAVPVTDDVRDCPQRTVRPRPRGCSGCGRTLY